MGAINVPRYCDAPYSVSQKTEPVSTSTYQPRISVSISNAHEVSRSAGHWKRELRNRNGPSAEGPPNSLIQCRGSSRSPPALFLVVPGGVFPALEAASRKWIPRG